MNLPSRHRTKAQEARRAAIYETPCLACLQLSQRHGRAFCCGAVTEQHTDGRTKPDAHDKTYALGEWHHLGRTHEGWTRHSMRVEYGPSLAEGSKPFHAAFGSDDDLLKMQDDLIGVAA